LFPIPTKLFLGQQQCLPTHPQATTFPLITIVSPTYLASDPYFRPFTLANRTRLLRDSRILLLDRPKPRDYQDNRSIWVKLTGISFPFSLP
jgi:hypothetical protein